MLKFDYLFLDLLLFMIVGFAVTPAAHVSLTPSPRAIPPEAFMGEHESQVFIHLFSLYKLIFNVFFIFFLFFF